MDILLGVLVIAGAYLLGSIPFGLLLTKAFSGLDVRSVGSGNIGATNVLRAAGRTPAVLTLLLDGVKGFLAVKIAGLVLPGGYGPVLAAMAAVAGHNFPVWLRFQGGKGVATSFGVVLAAAPWIGLACLLTWLGAALLWKHSSLAALIAFALYPLAVLATRSGDQPQGVLSLFLFGMIYYRHRANIRRLLDGTEPKIGARS